MPDPDNPHRPDGRRIEVEMRTTASPDEVWKAWTDPAALSRWFTDEARGEAKPGGVLVWIFRGFGEIPYPVVVAERPERLVLAGDIPGRGPFALEIVIRKSAGQTIVRLVNSGFLDGADWDEEYEGVRSGWAGSLELYRYFGEAGGLAAWLTREGALGEVGDRAELVLRDGVRLSGRVIAASGREKAVTWEEEDGPSSSSKGSRHRAAAWSACASPRGARIPAGSPGWSGTSPLPSSDSPRNSAGSARRPEGRVDPWHRFAASLRSNAGTAACTRR